MFYIRNKNFTLGEEMCVFSPAYARYEKLRARHLLILRLSREALICWINLRLEPKALILKWLRSTWKRRFEKRLPKMGLFMYVFSFAFSRNPMKSENGWRDQPTCFDSRNREETGLWGSSKDDTSFNNNFFYWEFDLSSDRMLTAWMRHASRTIWGQLHIVAQGLVILG